MNRPGHAVAGAFVGGIVYLGFSRLVDERLDLGGLLLAIGAGAVVACLHDFLEPAVHPNHRALIHILVVNGALGFGLRRLWLSAEGYPRRRILWMSLGSACLSHPVLDAIVRDVATFVTLRPASFLRRCNLHRLRWGTVPGGRLLGDEGGDVPFFHSFLVCE